MLEIKKRAYATRYAFHESFDMCNPNAGKNDVVTAESTIAGYFGYSKALTQSAYTVPLKHGIPIE